MSTTTITSRARIPAPKQLSSVNVTRDEFETFWHILMTYCQQDTGYYEFFSGGKYETWEPLCVNPTRGIKIEPNDTDQDQAEAIRQAQTQTVQLRATLNSLLTTIAAYCPDGLFKTVLTESTSIEWIRHRLTKVCNVDTSGRHLPKLLNIKYNKEDESPAAFMERIKSSFMDSLMPVNSKYHGNALKAPEALGPTLESLIVIHCLKAIHPELPDFIMNNKGMLFTTATPNFCDIQQELCDTMDTLLAQMEAQSNISRLQSFELDSSETIRWARSNPKPRFAGPRIPQTKPGVSSRPSTFSNRQQTSNKSCEYCHALGKDEKIWSTHDKLNCYDLFPEKRRSRTNARMLSVPILTDENDTWDLQDALETVENQFYAQSFGNTDPDQLSPQ